MLPDIKAVTTLRIKGRARFKLGEAQSDRIMITSLADSAQTGIFSLIYNFSMIATVIATTLEGIWVPWFINKLKAGSREEIKVVARDYIHLMTYAIFKVICAIPCTLICVNGQT